MLNKEQMKEVRDAVARVDLTKAVQDAKDMGIEVTKKELGYHGIYNQFGILEKIDIDRHFRINRNENMQINRNAKNETFSYTFKMEQTRKKSGIEIEELLVV